MATEIECVRWDALKIGNHIICPADGRVERVVFSRRYVGNQQMVRTSRHDHFKHYAAEVLRVGAGAEE